jgi:dihydroorotate dehydrogenase electron transfer subunit
MESPNMVKITRIVDEADDIKTFMFEYRFKTQPEVGQFMMVWLPGVDEIPLAFSYIPSKSTREYGITVAKVGTATERLHDLDKGEMIGIRGPYGTGFSVKGFKRILIVGGGIGMAPLGMVIDSIKNARSKVKVVIGAKTSSALLFPHRFRSAGIEPLLCTDDGTEGKKAFATELAEDLLEKDKFDLVIGCGPEPMLVNLVELCNSKNIPVQVSLERYMKCGVGVCDSCVFDIYHVCKDGPVFDGDLLAKTEDFGKWKRDPAGKKVRI